MEKMRLVLAFSLIAGADAACSSHVTPGTCNVLSCDPSRGPTVCVHGQCACPPGYCAAHGACVADTAEQLDAETRSASPLALAVLVGALSGMGVTGLFYTVSQMRRDPSIDEQPLLVSA
mmetsp:Transcript_26378/g.48600  ORF Transcript_26378/g.48600 Transcript_26378/m.48600 type:complete len:119 (-) Transcript_26378:46-402(-)